MIEMFGAPFDLGGARKGSRLGPDALRFAELAKSIESAKPNLIVRDRRDLSFDLSIERNIEGLPFALPIAQAITATRNEAARILADGNIPLMMGGEHSLTAGPVAACWQTFGPELGILWIDAHGDLNTPDTSSTKNIHGMPLALLAGLESGMTGLDDDHWKALRQAVDQVEIKLENVAWFGLRDVDLGERPRARKGCPITMHDIDKEGIQKSWERVYQYFLSRQIKHLYISFDVDALDPFLAPGTGTAVRGGLTYREAHLLAELIHESLADQSIHLVGLDLVEVSPVYDVDNQTATVTAEWAASLFGKTILGHPGDDLTDRGVN